MFEPSHPSGPVGPTARLLFAASLLWAGIAQAGEITGTVRAAVTGQPIQGITIRVEFNQLYDGVQCRLDCDPLTGTPVVLMEAEQRTDIDFVLEQASDISGRVLSAVTLSPNDGCRGISPKARAGPPNPRA